MDGAAGQDGFEVVADARGEDAGQLENVLAQEIFAAVLAPGKVRQMPVINVCYDPFGVEAHDGHRSELHDPLTLGGVCCIGRHRQSFTWAYDFAQAPAAEAGPKDRSLPGPPIRSALDSGERTVIVNGFEAFHLNPKPGHQGMGRQGVGRVPGHVLHEGRLVKGLFGHVFFILALEQRIHRRRARRLGDLDQLLQPDEPGKPAGEGHHRPLTVGALVGDGQGTRAHGHDRHRNREGLAELFPHEFPGQPAGVVHERLGAGRRRGLGQEIGEAQGEMGVLGVQPRPDVFQQVAERLEVEFAVKAGQRLHEPAHVRALEPGRQIHGQLHLGHGVLPASGPVAHDKRQPEILDAHPVHGNGHLGRSALYVAHGHGVCRLRRRGGSSPRAPSIGGMKRERDQ